MYYQGAGIPYKQYVRLHGHVFPVSALAIASLFLGKSMKEISHEACVHPNVLSVDCYILVCCVAFSNPFTTDYASGIKAYFIYLMKKE